MRINRRYKSYAGWVFLAVYLFLIGLSACHYHHYDFNKGNELFTGTSQSSRGNDIIQDYNGNCPVHHFSSSLIDYHYSSKGIAKLKPPVSEYLIAPAVYFNNTQYFSFLSLRAPPVSA
jgi:hypothetical protein